MGGFVVNSAPNPIQCEIPLQPIPTKGPKALKGLSKQYNVNWPGEVKCDTNALRSCGCCLDCCNSSVEFSVFLHLQRQREHVHHNGTLSQHRRRKPKDRECEDASDLDGQFNDLLFMLPLQRHLNVSGFAACK